MLLQLCILSKLIQQDRAAGKHADDGSWQTRQRWQRARKAEPQLR